MPPPKTKPPKKRPTKPKSIAAKPGVKKHTPKTFSIQPWTGENEGQKIILYGPSGAGKTTLTSMAPNVVFIGCDDGGRQIRNPLTDDPINHIPGIEDFPDCRDALRSKGLFDGFDTIAIDTATKLEEWIQNYLMAVHQKESFRKFGWDGPDLILEQFRLLMTDLDVHVRAGKNVILLAQQGQIKRSVADSADFLEDGPFVSHTNRSSAREELKQWADHVFRVGYADVQVQVEKGKKVGKVIGDSFERAIYTQGSLASTAKSRPLQPGNYHLPSVVSFDAEDDNTLWQFMFEGARLEEDAA